MVEADGGCSGTDLNLRNLGLLVHDSFASQSKYVLSLDNSSRTELMEASTSGFHVEKVLSKRHRRCLQGADARIVLLLLLLELSELLVDGVVVPCKPLLDFHPALALSDPKSAASCGFHGSKFLLALHVVLVLQSGHIIDISKYQVLGLRIR
jgi:hypothetical protein